MLKMITVLALVMLTSAAPADDGKLELAEGKDKRTNQRELGLFSGFFSKFQGFGQCSDLSEHDFELEVEWEIDANTAAAYPCSNGYATNFAANDQLLAKVRQTLDSAKPFQKCSKYCDIDNGSYKLKGAAFGAYNLDEALPNYLSSKFCGANGVLTQAGKAGGYRDDEPVCKCEAKYDDLDAASNAVIADGETSPSPGYIAGCEYCAAKITFKTKNCYDKPY